MDEATGIPRATSVNSSGITFPRTWIVILSAWTIVSLLFIAGGYVYSVHTSAQKQLQSLALLHQQLGKRITDTKSFLHAMAARLANIDSSNNQYVETILGSAAQLTPLVHLPGIEHLSFISANSPDKQVNRFGLEESVTSPLSTESILSSSNATLIQAGTDDLVIFKGVNHENTTQGFIKLHLPINDLTKDSAWSFVKITLPDKKNIKREIAERAYGVLKHPQGKTAANSFVKVPGSDWIITLQYPVVKGVWSFISTNRLYLLMYLVASLMLTLVIASVQRLMLKRPFQASNEQIITLDDRLNNALDTVSDIQVDLERSQRLQALTINSFRQQKTIATLVDERKNAMAAQAGETAVILTQTIAGTSQVPHEQEQLVEMGVDACQILDNVPLGIFKFAPVEEINVLELLEEIKKCFDAGIYSRTLDVKIHSKTKRSLKSDRSLISFYLFHFFAQRIGKLPQDGILDIVVTGSKKSLKVTFKDTGYAEQFGVENPDDLAISNFDLSQLQQIEKQLKASHTIGAKAGYNETVIRLPLQIDVPRIIWPENVVKLFEND